MHEFSYAQQILEAVLQNVADYPESRVTRIKLRASDALALDPASLRFCFEGIAEGTVLEGAHIDMDADGPELNCPQCGRVPIQSLLDPVCPQCGQLGDLATCTELIIEEIELDDQDG